LIGDTPLEDILLPTAIDWLDIAPANIDLIGAEIELVNMERRELRLKDALAKFQRVYKYVVIDCPPSLGLLTINTMTAATLYWCQFSANISPWKALDSLLTQLIA